ncbi:MAG TPA: RNA 2',3'-cyclic phosphodiesterase [Bacteroidales bacterium]|nr:RNA 2',3'-cyclic phosphodiesterase [Bacteroidales bacterium]
MKRLFIAVDIKPGDRLKEAIELVRKRLRKERIKWVDPDQMHLTLSFLGDTPEEVIPQLVNGLQKPMAGHIAFNLILETLGVFKSVHDPHVIWIGCRESAPFQQIKKEIDKSLPEYGFEPENRVFSPHLTLGRIKQLRQQNQLIQLITLNKDVIFQQQRIEYIVLYESRLNPEGPGYIPLHRFPLVST